MANNQYKITSELKKLGKKYEDMGYMIQYEKDGILVRNDADIEYHFIPVKTITLTGTIKNK